MKNIHIIPTDKPSNLFKDIKNKLMFNKEWIELPIGRVNQNIYITSDEKIKEGDYIFETDTNKVNIADKDYYRNEFDFKIILTTDQDLIKDGIQAIDDDFLEWFVNNPSCERVEINKEWNEERIIDGKDIGDYSFKILIPQEEPNPLTVGKEFYESADKNITVYRQETLEEAAERILANNIDGLRDALQDDDLFFFYKDVIQCYGESMAEWQAERMYSEEEVFNLCRDFAIFVQQKRPSYKNQLEWFEQFKKK